MPSTNIMFPCPDELKDELDKVSAQRKIARAALIRLAIAKEIGFDIKKANARSPRPTKYDSPEARREANRKRAADKRAAIAKLLDAVNKGEREEDIKALAQSLASQMKQ